MYSYIHNHTQIPRPCLRATIHKTEVRGPKTAPFVVYLIHVRTAFTVRGLARRYSDFVLLDAQVRVLAHTLNGAACMYVCMYRYVYTRTRTHTHTHIDISVYRYIHTYIHI